mmetsp:Transcript_55251/g.160034  ORF Transcript_55251/g.160034 Transcript_55251/m.160034 type:complete len:214 (-) Transcript_55251:824-1465(-)
MGSPLRRRRRQPRPHQPKMLDCKDANFVSFADRSARGAPDVVQRGGPASRDGGAQRAGVGVAPRLRRTWSDASSSCFSAWCVRCSGSSKSRRWSPATRRCATSTLISMQSLASQAARSNSLSRAYSGSSGTRGGARWSKRWDVICASRRPSAVAGASSRQCPMLRTAISERESMQRQPDAANISSRWPRTSWREPICVSKRSEKFFSWRRRDS